MKKMLFGMFAIALVFTACSDDDDEKKDVNGSILTKSEQTIESKGEKLSIDTNNATEWWIEGVMLTDSVHTDEFIENIAKEDTIDGEWYRIIREEDGTSLHIEAEENNEEKERKVEIALTTSTENTPEEFILIQKIKEIVIEE